MVNEEPLISSLGTALSPTFDKNSITPLLNISGIVNVRIADTFNVIYLPSRSMTIISYYSPKAYPTPLAWLSNKQLGRVIGLQG